MSCIWLALLFYPKSENTYLQLGYFLNSRSPLLISIAFFANTFHIFVITVCKSGSWRGCCWMRVVFPTQQSHFQRRERRQTQSATRIQSLKFALHFLSIQQVVQRLFNNRSNQPKTLCDSACFLDFVCRPFGSTPVESPSSFNHVVKCTDCLFHWSETIGSMCVYDVDVFQLQTVQRSSCSLDDVFP